ncbi:PqqD family peptide modification chaperone [Streptomonospora nanhaiensis]|uniref:PqqD family peptide modification chaperone n=1 Tax=Streptomonospora nanhaiensis TaxID=1323731 RepID=UPI0027E2CAEF|nr:PqqD family peptide modification chaperone [Streptomonospora nanhaiensis]
MLRLPDHVALTATGDGAMLLDTRTGRVFHLNMTGHHALLGALAGGPDGAARRLRERYGITAERARSDAAAVLTALAQHHLLVESAL